jgi:hypothetical protein
MALDRTFQIDDHQSTALLHLEPQDPQSKEIRKILV